MQLDHPLLAFGFGNLLMLGWLAAAAAPILIHLWNKRRYREVPWAAIEYLMSAMRKNSRRMRLEQWLLLAVRTLIIVLVVLAVAQPFLQHAGLAMTPGERTLKVLVLDASYSMAYKPTDKSSFERAKQWAIQVVEESAAGDAFALVLMGAPPSVIVGTPAIEQAGFLEEINNLRMPHGGADLSAALVQVEQILATAAAAGLTRKEVFFFTDLGRTTWLPEQRDSEEAEFRSRLSRLAQEATLLVLDLGQAGEENLAVTELSIQDPYATTSREVTVTAQVRNFGNQPRNHHLVELYVDGRRVKEAYVDVAGGAQTPMTFTHRFDAPGEHIVEARLGPDLLEVDNHRWLSLPVKEHVRVLCINGKPGSAPMSGATDYLALALNPDGDDPRSTSPIQVEIASESALVERDLARYDCVFLCNVAQFTAQEARVLSTVLARGGGLVFFLGDQVLPERYNRELAGEQQVRVLPARLGQAAGEGSYRFDPLGYRHPLLQVFQGREQSGLLTTPVYQYLRLTPSAQARVALAFEGGDPAIVEESLGGGRSVLIATEGSLSSLDPASHQPWTTLPAWPSFVPLAQEILAWAVGGQLLDHNVLVGQTLGETLPAIASRPTVTVTPPGGPPEELRMELDAQSSRWSFADTYVSGVYRVTLGAPLSREELYAVNVDTAESNLARIAADELPREFATHRRGNVENDDLAGLVGRRSGLHKDLLYGVFGLLLAECCLAWWFGNAQR